MGNNFLDNIKGVVIHCKKDGFIASCNPAVHSIANGQGPKEAVYICKNECSLPITTQEELDRYFESEFIDKESNQSQ